MPAAPAQLGCLRDGHLTMTRRAAQQLGPAQRRCPQPWLEWRTSICQLSRSSLGQPTKATGKQRRASPMADRHHECGRQVPGAEFGGSAVKLRPTADFRTLMKRTIKFHGQHHLCVRPADAVDTPFLDQSLPTCLKWHLAGAGIAVVLSANIAWAFSLATARGQYSVKTRSDDHKGGGKWPLGSFTQRTSIWTAR